MDLNATVGVPLVVLVMAASLFRLWWIWGRSSCVRCGHEHRDCVCESHDTLMRPRR